MPLNLRDRAIEVCELSHVCYHLDRLASDSLSPPEEAATVPTVARDFMH
jgi:hypothetical protein